MFYISFTKSTPFLIESASSSFIASTSAASYGIIGPMGITSSTPDGPKRTCGRHSGRDGEGDTQWERRCGRYTVGETVRETHSGRDGEGDTVGETAQAHLGGEVRQPGHHGRRDVGALDDILLSVETAQARVRHLRARVGHGQRGAALPRLGCHHLSERERDGEED
jgi:hypothetical protein